MLHKTRGIVLHHIKYSESSLIVKIFTESFGLQAYLVKGSRSKRSSLRSSLFQPMTLLDLVVYHREKNELQHIRDAGLAEPFHSISSDLRKSTIALFLSEILLKSIKESEANKEMFEFLASSLHFLDTLSEGIENYHTYFLIKLSRYLGFFPQGNPGENGYFDLREGRFTAFHPQHTDFLDEGLSRDMFLITSAQAGDLSSFSFSKQSRSELLNGILLYYQIHLSGVGNFKSLEILREVFH